MRPVPMLDVAPLVRLLLTLFLTVGSGRSLQAFVE
jgi:hypothetical protein